jgi:hypothetical protein
VPGIRLLEGDAEFTGTGCGSRFGGLEQRRSPPTGSAHEWAPARSSPLRGGRLFSQPARPYPDARGARAPGRLQHGHKATTERPVRRPRRELPCVTGRITLGSMFGSEGDGSGAGVGADSDAHRLPAVLHTAPAAVLMIDPPRSWSSTPTRPRSSSPANACACRSTSTPGAMPQASPTSAGGG